MKKLIILITCLLALQFAAEAQVCYIKYSYDNAGNRIKREFFCGAVDTISNVVVIEEPIGPSPAKTAGIKITQPEGAASEIAVFPNPGTGKYRVTVTNNKTAYPLSVLSNNGQVLFTRQLDANTDFVDLTGYPNGTYFFVFSLGKQHATLKVVKQ
jgi:Secretion system C-terminal sorting domain